MSTSSGFCEPLLNYNQMENSSAYHGGHGPSPIPTHQSHPAAALVAFSQASSLSEALRLSRPFPQVKIINNQKKKTRRQNFFFSALFLTFLYQLPESWKTTFWFIVFFFPFFIFFSAHTEFRWQGFKQSIFDCFIGRIASVWSWSRCCSCSRRRSRRPSSRIDLAVSQFAQSIFSSRSVTRSEITIR